MKEIKDKWTPAQKEARRAKGAVIVTAAAGSGKTAVLVERVIDKLLDPEQNISADRLLIVTFTNMAAAEMRQRIEKRLAEEILKNPHNINLKKQQLLISSADICTIDSFCIKLVRNNFNLLGISPDFKIIDKSTELKLRQETVTEIFDKRLEKADKNFLEFVKITDSVYGDGNATEMVLRLYEYIISMPNPLKWLSWALDSYKPKSFEKGVWAEYAYKALKEKNNALKSALLGAYSDLREDDELFLKCGAEAEKLIKKAGDIALAIDEKNWDLLCSTINALVDPFPRIQSNRVSNPELLNRVRECYKAALKKLEGYKDFVPFTAAEAMAELEISGRYVKELLDTCGEFYESYHRKLCEGGALTFALIEQLAISLLTVSDSEGNLVPSPLTERVSQMYDEVMVDEFQDVNSLQDTLFTLLSSGGKRLFTVGDAKQSIYGFRRANPEFFIEKSEKATLFNDDLPPETLKRVVLSKNFRSREGICRLVNGFFGLNMVKDFGKIKYDNNEMLFPGAEYADNNETAAEFHLIEASGELKPAVAEGEYLADFITAQINKEPFLKGENGQLRKARYSDIAILLRGNKSISFLAKILKSRGIPVSVEGGDFFETREIKTVISALKAVNNPCDEIAILALMSSPIFGFSEDELVGLKLKNNKVKLYTEVTRLAKAGDQKAVHFIAKLENWRKYGATLSVADFVTYIINDSGYYYLVCAYEEKERRRANLLCLEELAAAFTREKAGDLSEFLRYTDYLAGTGEIKSASPRSGDFVRFFTMHGSKGLQFPITVLADLSSEFSTRDAEKRYIFSDKLGVAINPVDDEENRVKKSFTKELVNDLVLRTQREEELRLLYVAMTRAKEKLAIFLSAENVGSKLTKYAEALAGIRFENGAFSVTEINSAKCYADWLYKYFLLLPCSKSLRDEFGIEPITAPASITDFKENLGCYYTVLEKPAETVKTETEAKPEPDLKLADSIKKVFGYEYPFKELRSVETKTSVSVLTKRSVDREFCATLRPAFLSSGGLTPRERGTALHKFMEFADFKAAAVNPEAEIQRLYEYEYISLAEKEAIDQEKIKKFFATELFDRILNCDRLFREQRFLLEVKAGELHPELSDAAKGQGVIIQGAVDCMFIEGDHIVIIDFKTDRVTDENMFLTHYAEQLKTYSLAAEKMFNLKVTECYIYSLHMSKVIKV